MKFLALFTQKTSIAHPFYVAIFISLIWGWGIPIVKQALQLTSPYTFLTYRYAFTSLLFIVYVLIFRKQLHFPRTPQQWFLIIMYGILGMGIKVGIQLEGLSRTTSLEASFIGAIAPIIVAIVSIMFLKENITARESVGYLLSLLGTLFIILTPDQVIGTNAIRNNIFGNILIFTSHIIGAIALVTAIFSLRKKISPAIIAATTFICGFLINAPIAILEHGSFNNLVTFLISAPMEIHIPAWYMVILGGFFAHLYHTRVQAIVPAHKLVILQYLQPVIVAPLAIFWLGESFNINFAIGGIIIIFGVYLSETHSNIIPKLPHFHFHLHH